jgi:hypothetical protein
MRAECECSAEYMSAEFDCRVWLQSMSADYMNAGYECRGVSAE